MKHIVHIKHILSCLYIPPDWSAFNASTRTEEVITSQVAFLQPVNESPTELSAIYIVLKCSQYFGKCLGLSEIDCVFDQACFAKACLVKWHSPEEFSNVSFRLDTSVYQYHFQAIWRCWFS